MAAAAARVVVVAVLLMQCCGVILAARPLLRDDAAAEDGRGWQLGQAAAGAHQLATHRMKMSRPGEGNPSGWVDGNHPSSTTPVGLGVANPATP